jgi:glycosyltransferase involved in cell wall biosynthesis/CelD/BcsL family acetyltransferase involved in cellulose biosynthesis
VDIPDFESVRIAVVETAALGGLLHYSVQLGDALAERGHEVDLITPRGNELAGHESRSRMRAVLPPPVRTARDVQSKPLYLARRGLIALRLVAAWARILWETRPGRYDVVLIGADIALPPATVGALLLSVIPGRPRLIRIAHNVRAFNRQGGTALYRSASLAEALLRRLYPRFDLVFVHGERSREEFERTWRSKRIAVIPHGDERLFGREPPPPSNEERILFFGDWRKVKGLEVLMEAFDELVARRPSVRLTIAGSPASADWHPDLVRRWAAGHAEHVQVIDHYVPVEDVPRVFSDARVVATPYLAGYQSGVIHLAMTMARAVVTTDVGDLGTAVADGQTGRVVPPGDPKALATALEELLADPDRAQRFGTEARRRVLADSGWERVAESVDLELQALPGVTPLRPAAMATAHAQVPHVTVTELRGSEIDALEGVWRDLEARAPSASPYVGFDWLRAWTRTYAPHRLHLVRIEDPDAVRALALVDVRSGGRWRFAGDPVTPERALLCETGREAESWAALSRWLADHRRSWATIEARGVRPGTTLSGASAAAEPVPVLRLPASFDDFLAARSANMQQEIRRKRRRLEQAGGVVRPVPPDELEPALDAFIALHKLRAEQKGERHPSVDARLAQMLAAAGAAPGWSLTLHEVSLDGRTLGVRVTLQTRDTSYLYNVGIDPDAGRFSPGILLTVAAIEDAIEKGHQTVEMGPGLFGYKLSLGGEPDERLVLEAGSPSLRGRVFGLPARAYRWMVRRPRLAEPTRRLNEWRVGLKHGD